jgi:hypothetical protein
MDNVEELIKLIEAEGFRWLLRNRASHDVGYSQPGAYFAHVFNDTLKNSCRHWADSPVECLRVAFDTCMSHVHEAR